MCAKKYFTTHQSVRQKMQTPPQPPHLSAQTAFQISSTHIKTFHDVVETLLGQALNTIRYHAELQALGCRFTVPAWIPGFACYSPQHVAHMLTRVLGTLDYKVSEFGNLAAGPIVLEISWRHARRLTLSDQRGGESAARLQSVIHQTRIPAATAGRGGGRSRARCTSESKTVVILS